MVLVRAFGEHGKRKRRAESNRPIRLAGLIVSDALLLILGTRKASSTESGVCERSYQVRSTIVEVSGAATRGHVTRPHLREITALDLSNHGLTSLSTGDVEGLVRLRTPDLSHNLLASLPQDIFDSLYLLKDRRADVHYSDGSIVFVRIRVRRARPQPHRRGRTS